MTSNCLKRLGLWRLKRLQEEDLAKLVFCAVASCQFLTFSVHHAWKWILAGPLSTRHKDPRALQLCKSKPCHPPPFIFSALLDRSRSSLICSSGSRAFSAIATHLTFGQNQQPDLPVPSALSTSRQQTNNGAHPSRLP